MYFGGFVLLISPSDRSIMLEVLPIGEDAGWRVSLGALRIPDLSRGCAPSALDSQLNLV